MRIHVRAAAAAAKSALAVLGARRAALLLVTGLALAAAPAEATPTTFFGQDVPAVDGIPASHPLSDAARSQFFSMLVDPGTEDFSGFCSGDEATLELSFQDPARGQQSPPGSGTEIETGKLYDGTGEGFIATSQIAKTGFGISGEEFWKNTTEDDDDALFRVAFGAPVHAFGFYATAWETLSHPGETQLVLDLKLEDGTVQTIVIPHDTTTTVTGKVFYFGVISDAAFVKASLRNEGTQEGDVIGFDDFTVAHMVVPEPATGWLLGGGVLALLGARRRLARRRSGSLAQG